MSVVDTILMSMMSTTQTISYSTVNNKQQKKKIHKMEQEILQLKKVITDNKTKVDQISLEFINLMHKGSKNNLIEGYETAPNTRDVHKLIAKNEGNNTKFYEVLKFCIL